MMYDILYDVTIVKIMYIVLENSNDGVRGNRNYSNTYMYSFNIQFRIS